MHLLGLMFVFYHAILFFVLHKKPTGRALTRAGALNIAKLLLPPKAGHPPSFGLDLISKNRPDGYCRRAVRSIFPVAVDGVRHDLLPLISLQKIMGED